MQKSILNFIQIDFGRKQEILTQPRVGFFIAQKQHKPPDEAVFFAPAWFVRGGGLWSFIAFDKKTYTIL